MNNTAGLTKQRQTKKEAPDTDTELQNDDIVIL